MRKFILFDIDNTLFDSPSYKIALFDKLTPLLEKEGIKDAKTICADVYRECRKASGLFSPELFFTTLKEKLVLKKESKEKIMQQIFDPKLLQQYIYKEAKDTLIKLKTYGELGLFSQGEEGIQKAKVKELLHLFTPEHIHIMYNKKELFHTILAHYTKEQVVIVDDALPILFAVKKQYPHVTVIWMKRGEYANVQQPIENFMPDKTIMKLHELIDIIKT